MKLRITAPLIALFSVVVLASSVVGQAHAVAPYSVSVFAKSLLGVYFQPDSIAAVNGHIFIGFGNNVSTR